MAVDWHEFDLRPLADVLAKALPAVESRRTLRAFELVVAAARADAGLLPDLLAAVVSLVAVANGETPRAVAETLFRGAVSDETWRELYLPIFS